MREMCVLQITMTWLLFLHFEVLRTDSKTIGWRIQSTLVIVLHNKSIWNGIVTPFFIDLFVCFSNFIHQTIGTNANNKRYDFYPFLLFPFTDDPFMLSYAQLYDSDCPLLLSSVRALLSPVEGMIRERNKIVSLFPPGAPWRRRHSIRR